MKSIINLFITIFLLGAANFVSAQCGPTLVEPSPQLSGLCEGTTDTIVFSANGICYGNYEYQVVTSSNAIVQAWSTDTTYITTPSVTDTYTVYARCSGCPSTEVSDTFLIEVIPEATISAPSFVCHGTMVDMTASGPDSTLMSWWDAETNGTQLSSTHNYTSPPLTQTDTFHMQVNGVVTGGSNLGSILITECGLEGFPGNSSADYVEISNLYSTSVNTAGWVVAISDSYTNINTRNNILWNLPASFTPCSMLSKTDVSGQPNYWGNNMYWLSGSPGWVAIIDDVGQIVDFIAWGWSAAQLANFSINVNGNTVTLGTEWVGNGCNATCTTVGGVPYSLSRTGNSDNNDASDFICQASSLNVVNPGLSCGWISSNITCPYQTVVVIDSLPSATAPATTYVTCYADIPAPDPLIITNVTDDFTANPTVTFIDEVSDGNLCPETLTRTYQVADSCNFIEVYHIIVINDTSAPVLDPAPPNLSVSCYSDVPVMGTLNYTDNCLGNGSVTGVEVSSGTTCPEVLTRTWTISDTCGNTATQTQIITIHDTIAPIIEPAPANLSLQCPSDLPPMAALNWTDNCDGTGVLTGVEVTDGLTCPETITRTWTTTDGCGNSSTEVQVIVINDDTPPTASNLPLMQVTVLPPPDVSVVTDAADNCGTPLVEWVNDVSDNGFCPEYVVRTYSLTDDCGNVSYINRTFIVGDLTPEAKITANPSLLDNLSDGWVQFYNQTTGATDYMWNFGDGTPYIYDRNTDHQFDITKSTTYDVWMVATSEFGCIDSTNIQILVFQELLYYIPTAFTPNDDGFNQFFEPIFAAGFNPDDYNFKIFNRWGEILFESNNHEVGWDGTYGGKLSPEGTYVYKIEFGIERSTERKIITGHFSLLK